MNRFRRRDRRQIDPYTVIYDLPHNNISIVRDFEISQKCKREDTLTLKETAMKLQSVNHKLGD